MFDRELSGDKILKFPKPAQNKQANNDVLQTLLQSLRDADPIAGGDDDPPMAGAKVASDGCVQIACGSQNLQMQQADVMRQQAEGSHNIQLSGLNVMVRLDVPRNTSIVAGVTVSRIWRVLVYVLVVVVAFLA